MKKVFQAQGLLHGKRAGLLSLAQCGGGGGGGRGLGFIFLFFMGPFLQGMSQGVGFRDV